MALIDHWPLLGLRVTTPRLELRYPDEALACELLELAARGVHPPDEMPFSVPWTDTPAGELPRVSLQQWYWRNRAELVPEKWSVGLAVFEDGELVGLQDLIGEGFPQRRVVASGSWLGIGHHGRGIGTEMRRAILHLGFAGLGAEFAETAAWEDNPASLGVTRKLGYADVGDSVEVRRGVPTRMLRFRMPRSHWESRLRSDDVEVEGLEPCLPLLGAVPA